jgi:1-acyl-sn-glycerol-3-phosphate acyltransferase
MRWLYSFIFFRLCGWRITNHIPPDLDRYICVVAPHTSNWDFPIGIFTRTLGNMGDVKFLAKETLFKPPFGWFFRFMGGYPVVRSKSINQVDTIAAMFQRGEIHKVTIAPEGTRKYQPKWKTGFHHIARKAGIPIILATFDYGNKEVILTAPFPLTDDPEGDIERMKDWFRPHKGKNPEDGVR